MSDPATGIDATTTGGVGVTALGVLGLIGAWLKKQMGEKNQMAADIQEMKGHIGDLRDQGIEHKSTLNAMVAILEGIKETDSRLALLLEKQDMKTDMHRESMRDQLNRIENRHA